MLTDLISALTLGSVYLLFALGLSLAWGTIGILNFAHGAIFMFSAFTGYLLVSHVALPMIVLVLIGVAVGAVMSVGVHVIAYEQIIKRAKDMQAAEMQILIGGIGIASIPLALAQRETESNPFGFTGTTHQVKLFVLGDVRITDVQIIILLTALVLGTGVALWLRRARAGLALRGIGVDAEVAGMMGIDRRRFAILTMAVAGGMAGLAAVLFTFNLGAMIPESGDTLMIKAFAVIILGGVGSTLGVVVGAYFLAFAETGILTYTGGTWVDAVSFGLILVVLLLRPNGLFGRKVVRRT
ncbi:branched-chain amino acid ABC transporter permease [Nakamurella sp. YIM 132087]|uniref:Branched-chain amino acid ABC transporter permease n=1 Tax=Nakamurella alba TaxID=2665158 RepID=A0A7K1FH74_9ACTN|nr:branched-chain amino acid ABC transporter permease [Nakamurella alba]MTD13416.1 branched-chain amino acid ABC transporter permease [Nakamurella alba]